MGKKKPSVLRYGTGSKTIAPQTTVRMPEAVKEFLKEAAKKDYRTLNDFMVHAALVYAKDHLNLEYEEPTEKRKKKKS